MPPPLPIPSGFEPIPFPPIPFPPMPIPSMFAGGILMEPCCKVRVKKRVRSSRIISCSECNCLRSDLVRSILAISESTSVSQLHWHLQSSKLNSSHWQSQSQPSKEDASYSSSLARSINGASSSKNEAGSFWSLCDTTRSAIHRPSHRSVWDASRAMHSKLILWNMVAKCMLGFVFGVDSLFRMLLLRLFLWDWWSVCNYFKKCFQIYHNSSRLFSTRNVMPRIPYVIISKLARLVSDILTVPLAKSDSAEAALFRNEWLCWTIKFKPWMKSSSINLNIDVTVCHSVWIRVFVDLKYLL